jgi:hypothetical protein
MGLMSYSSLTVTQENRIERLNSIYFNGRCGCEDNIKVDIKEIRYKCVDWILIYFNPRVTVLTVAQVV